VLVFIDESGDPGFKIAAGSSSVFVLAMVIFDDHAEAARTQAVVAGTRARLGVKPEFKFNKCRADFRDGFFDAISDHCFRVRAIVVKKDLIWSERLRSDVESFYRFFLKSMMRFDDEALKDATVVIDGSGDREFKRNLKAYIQRHVQAGAVSEIKLKNSRAEPASSTGRYVRRSHREIVSNRPERPRSMAYPIGQTPGGSLGVQMMRPAPYPTERLARHHTVTVRGSGAAWPP
jgi:hypothetical protein